MRLEETMGILAVEQQIAHLPAVEVSDEYVRISHRIT
jgi:hypothetical protein